MSSEKDSTETLQSSTSSLLIFPLSFHYFASREWRGSSFKDGFTSLEWWCEENLSKFFHSMRNNKDCNVLFLWLHYHSVSRNFELVANCLNNENTLWWQSEKSLGWTPYKFSVVSTYASIPSRITNVSLSIKPKASKWPTADYIVLSFLCKRAGFELRSLRHIKNFVYLTMELWRCEASRTIYFLTSSCFEYENNVEEQLIPYKGVRCKWSTSFKFSTKPHP